MYTQCSKCETVFRLSAETLRAAGGQVRCGRCGEEFNALARLAEEPTAFPAGESSLESETRADAILQSAAPAPLTSASMPSAGTPERHAAPVPDGIEIAHLEIFDPPDEDLDLDASLEFTLPPGELDRIFIETSPSPLQLLAASAKLSAARGAPTQAAPTQSPPTEATSAQTAPAQPAPAQATSAQSAPAQSAPAQGAPSQSAPAHAALTRSAPPQGASAQTATPQPVSAQPLEPPPPARAAASGAAPGKPAQSTPARTLNPIISEISGLAVSENVRQEMLSGYRAAELPEINAPRGRQWPPAVWISAAAVLAALLILQIVQTNREWLSVHAPRIDGRPAALSAYQLRQWGVTGDPAANGTLRVRASIMNTAAQLQPYPLLRVTLADRFGTRVGARDFESAEYLGKAPARMIAPGERVDATLNILDPGKDAEGFEIDVCVRTAEKKIVCAGDAGSANAPADAAAARQTK